MVRLSLEVMIHLGDSFEDPVLFTVSRLTFTYLMGHPEVQEYVKGRTFYQIIAFLTYSLLIQVHRAVSCALKHFTSKVIS